MRSIERGAGHNTDKSVEQSSNRAVIDSVIKRGVELLDRGIKQGTLTLDLDRWKVPEHLADRLDCGSIPGILLGLLVKSARTLQSIQLLSRHGLGSDASVIGRTLVETHAAVLELIGNDWAEKLLRYHACIMKHQIAIIEGLMRNPELNFREYEHAPRFEAVLEGSREQLRLTGLEDIGNNWIMDGIQGALGRASLESIYDGMYRIGARASHAFDSNDFVYGPDESGGFVVIATGRWTDSILFSAPHVYLGTLILVSDAFGWGLASEARELQAELAGLLRASMPAEKRMKPKVQSRPPELVARQVVALLRKAPGRSAKQIAEKLAIAAEDAGRAIEQLLRVGAIEQAQGTEGATFSARRSAARTKVTGGSGRLTTQPAKSRRPKRRSGEPASKAAASLKRKRARKA